MIASIHLPHLHAPVDANEIQTERIHNGGGGGDWPLAASMDIYKNIHKYIKIDGRI